MDLKKVILIEFKLPEYEPMQYATLGGGNVMGALYPPIVTKFKECYNVLGESNINSELKNGDEFLFRIKDKNMYMKILANEIIYTTHNNLELYLVWDIDSITALEKKINESHSHNMSNSLHVHNHSTYQPEPINYNRRNYRGF